MCETNLGIVDKTDKVPDSSILLRNASIRALYTKLLRFWPFFIAVPDNETAVSGGPTNPRQAENTDTQVPFSIQQCKQMHHSLNVLNSLKPSF